MALWREIRVIPMPIEAIAECTVRSGSQLQRLHRARGLRTI